MKKSNRKDKILDGVIELIATRGLEGVTHRAVDQAVGLPQGSTTYYFPKKTALIIAAAEQLADQLGKDCDELQVGFAECVAKQGMDAAIAYVGDYLVSYADNSRHLFLARLELTVASTRNDEFSDLGDLLTEAARRPIEFFLKLISDGSTDVPVETCAGLIDGITLMYATGQGPKPTTNQIAAVFRSIL